MGLENLEIRMDIRRAGVTQYAVAKAMDISESYFSRLLRDPVTEEKRKEIYDAIYEASQGATRE